MFVVYVILSGLLQCTMLRDLNLLVVLAVFAGLRKGPIGGLLISSAIGIYAGILSASSFASNIILFGLIGLASGVAKIHIYYKENIFVDFVFSFCGVLLFYFAYFVFADVNGTPIFTTALFSAAISPLLFRMIEKKI